jgi:hypothetical protein
VSVDAVSIRKLVFWPAVITLAVTVLRLTGEFLNWAPALFSRAPGGGGALVGISWLPPVFAILFAIQLVGMGHGPASGGRAIGRALLGLAVTAALMFGVISLGIVQEGQFSLLALFVMTGAIAVGAAIAWSGWPALGKTLLVYAYAARIPVVVVMLLAFAGNWGTHYDGLPPGVPEMGLLQKWVMFGVLPQMLTWIAIAVLSGAVLGSIAGAVALRRGAPAARPAVA